MGRGHQPSPVPSPGEVSPRAPSVRSASVSDASVRYSRVLPQDTEGSFRDKDLDAAGRKNVRFSPPSRAPPCSAQKFSGSGKASPRNKICQGWESSGTAAPTAGPAASAGTVPGRSSAPASPGDWPLPGGLASKASSVGLPDRRTIICDLDDNFFYDSLHIGPPPAEAGDQEMYLSVLKHLLNQDMRKLVREELQAVLSRPGRAHDAPIPTNSSRLQPAGDEQAESQTGAFVPKAASGKPTVDMYPPEADMPEVRMSSAQLFKRSQTIDQPTMDWEGDDSEESDQDPLARLPAPVRRVLRLLTHPFSNCGAAEAHRQPRRLERFVEGRAWDALVNVVILLNCTFMVFSLDYQIANIKEERSIGSFFSVCDLCFLLFYTVEFILKLAAYGWYYFFGVHWRHNLFDFVLLASNMQSVSLTLLDGGKHMQNLSWLRMLRLVRLLKALRVLRLAENFKTLRAILRSLMSSFWTLVWSCCMLTLVYFIFALVFVSGLAVHLEAEVDNLDQRHYDNLISSYGSVSAAMESLVMASTGGKDWGEDYSLMKTVGVMNQGVFLFFIFFIQVALMNIILGIFVDDAMMSLKPDDYQLAHAKALEDKRLQRELEELCGEVDLNGSGKLNEDEWHKIMNKKSKRELLEMMGLPPHHVHQYFHIICKANHAHTGEANVTIADFVKGCMRLRGSASPFDVNLLFFELADLKELMLKEISILQGS